MRIIVEMADHSGVDDRRRRANKKRERGQEEEQEEEHQRVARFDRGGRGWQPFGGIGFSFR